MAPPVETHTEASPPSGVVGASVLVPQEVSPPAQTSDPLSQEGRKEFVPEQHVNVSSPHALCGTQHTFDD
jgi:hypothetical protein